MSNNDYLLSSRLASRITFQKLESDGRNPDYSPKAPEWKDVAKAWAEVLTIGGEEGRVAAADSMQVKYRITIRRRRDIDPSMRILLPSGVTAHIKSIRDPDGRGVYLEINALEIQGAV